MNKQTIKSILHTYFQRRDFTRNEDRAISQMINEEYDKSTF